MKNFPDGFLTDRSAFCELPILPRLQHLFKNYWRYYEHVQIQWKIESEKAGKSGKYLPFWCQSAQFTTNEEIEFLIKYREEYLWISWLNLTNSGPFLDQSRCDRCNFDGSHSIYRVESSIYQRVVYWTHSSGDQLENGGVVFSITQPSCLFSRQFLSIVCCF